MSTLDKSGTLQECRLDFLESQQVWSLSLKQNSGAIPTYGWPKQWASFRYVSVSSSNEFRAHFLENEQPEIPNKTTCCQAAQKEEKVCIKVLFEKGWHY